MKTTCFDVSIADHIAHIVLNRPEKRNSMITAFWDELPAIISELEQDDSVRVIVISSTGPHFTAGIDTAVFSSSEAVTDDPLEVEHQRRRHGARFYDNVLRMQRTFNCLEECRVPVLAAIQGGAIGGGVDLITACDMRYMSKEGFLTIFEINIGMTADVGTFPRITKLIPEGIARELAYTGRRMGAQEAKEIGLVNAVFDSHEELLAGVMDVAREITKKAPIAIYGSKRLITYSRDHSTADSLDYISIWNASMLSSAEVREAMAAAGEKREGDFASLPPKKHTMSDTVA
ncbi:MAG: crotonase/enoyl-CoA hydratase family protein [Proteobacteria bacterium]|nr:crotonase/enoyl-CoA hydratase family protein [Pseudomonadota bacterium]MDA0897417.1 crotonase/enoyl-CoA hydratase family protein [Pseudomonadota bacterium]MDA1245521.1 crotonase/enoyl-CoA hydratase family protein [Pseudomonadota bacterium]